MKISKKEKIIAYTYAMLVELNKMNQEFGFHQCVCESLGCYTHKDMHMISFAEGYSVHDFPEFLQQRPTDASFHSSWWPVHSKLRLKAIEKAIQLTEQL